MIKQPSVPREPLDEDEDGNTDQSPLVRLAREHWAVNAELLRIYGTRTPQAKPLNDFHTEGTDG
jgi:hypothetical protein